LHFSGISSKCGHRWLWCGS